MTLSLTWLAGIAAVELVGFGLVGLLVTRNLIKVVVAMQILVKGALVALVLAGHLTGQVQTAPGRRAHRHRRRYHRLGGGVGPGRPGTAVVRHPGSPGVVVAPEVTDADHRHACDSLDRPPLAGRAPGLAYGRCEAEAQHGLAITFALAGAVAAVA